MWNKLPPEIRDSDFDHTHQRLSDAAAAFNRASVNQLLPAIERLSRIIGASLRSNIRPPIILTRRELAAQERGYDVPDWVWEVEEQQRKTFGSGNGRIMRD